ncbi:MAG: ATP-binding cassette domain-containing protein, partial [Candidatus Electrothrix sp. LOE1_4_5]|nr:ATP-binding cassette domain-containing protein [Candidatus Electrothrix gigas]
FENIVTSLNQEPVKGDHYKKPKGYSSIRYEGISFTYRTRDDRPFFIGPLDISFSANEIVSITGCNGSGKSTLLHLITGMFPLDSGCCFLNDDKEIDIRLYRELFSPIFTNFHLFDRLYGMKEVDEVMLNKLLNRFGLEKKVQWTGDKFSTLDLSTGQKKRLALVITIMEDKPIYIFDEWAADQDPHFRKYFYTTLLSEFRAQGKTVIAVTHDDKYFYIADRILKLDYS